MVGSVRTVVTLGTVGTEVTLGTVIAVEPLVTVSTELATVTLGTVVAVEPLGTFKTLETVGPCDLNRNLERGITSLTMLFRVFWGKALLDFRCNSCQHSLSFSVATNLRVNIKIEGVLYPENAREKMTLCPHKMIIIII